MVMCLSVVRFAGGGGSEEAPCCLQLVAICYVRSVVRTCNEGESAGYEWRCDCKGTCSACYGPRTEYSCSCKLEMEKTENCKRDKVAERWHSEKV